MQQKKKILFMNNTLTVGGIVSSMVNMANELSKDYDVSVFCYDSDGVMKEKLLPEVKVIKSNRRAVALCNTLGKDKKLGLRYFLFKVFARVWSVVFDNRFPIWLARKKQKHLGSYDLACSFTHEGEKHLEYTGLIRMLIEKVDSPVKTSWIHCDYNFVKKSKFNDRYFNKVDYMVGVSKSVANAFKLTHENVKTPVVYCPNMLDYNRIYTLSKEEQQEPFISSGIICFSACRLCAVKAIPRAVRAFAEVMKKNDVYWYIAGDGDKKQEILDTAKECGVEDRVILIGETTNPFPYIKNCDLYLSVSLHEAAPMVYGEAKALHTPVFSTETLSAREMLDEGIDFICKNDVLDMQKVFDTATKDKNELAIRRSKLKDYVGTNDKVKEIFKNWLGEHGE